MDKTRDYYIKWSKSEREIHISYYFMWNLNYYINELTYKTETDPQIERRDSWLPGAEVRDGLGVWLPDANYSLQNGQKRSYCVAQATIFNILW